MEAERRTSRRKPDSPRITTRPASSPSGNSAWKRFLERAPRHRLVEKGRGGSFVGRISVADEERRRSSSRNIKRDITSGPLFCSYGRAWKYLAVNETNKFPGTVYSPPPCIFQGRWSSLPPDSPLLRKRSKREREREEEGEGTGHFLSRGQSRCGSLYVRQFRETILTPGVVHSITILLSARCRFKFAPSHVRARAVVTETFLRFPFVTALRLDLSFHFGDGGH